MINYAIMIILFCSAMPPDDAAWCRKEMNFCVHNLVKEKSIGEAYEWCQENYYD